jgi:hypothetical protein
MELVTSAAAVPVVALLPPVSAAATAAGDQGHAHALWRIALSEYECTKAAFEQACTDYSAAQRTVWDAQEGNAYEKYCLKQFESAEEETSEAHDAARKTLFATPAPDAAAMLLKLELLTSYLTECCADDREHVAAIRDDARRLLVTP